MYQRAQDLQTVTGNMATLGSRLCIYCNICTYSESKLMKVDKEKVPVLEDNIKQGVVTRVVVREARGKGRGRGRGQRRGGVHGQGGHSRVGSSQTTDQQWRDQTTDITVESFTKGVGPNVPNSAHIRDIFQHFFTTTLIDMIVDQANLYTSQVMEPSQYDKWTKFTADELWAYFGFIILMGINQLADYWKLDPTCRYRPIADRITYDQKYLDIYIS